MTITQIFSLMITAILIENFIFVKFLGCCPFLGVSKKMDTAIGMSLAVIFVMTLASIVTWIINTYVLVPLQLEYMQTVAFILVIATLVQFVEMVLIKVMPALYQALGIYLPLITTNCAVLGVAILNINKGLNLFGSALYGFSGGVGFMLAILLFASVRERIEFCDYPKCFDGFPIALITAALLSLAFMGFQGLKIW
ncbi:MAG: electron transport complex subunit RsxA [Clostridiales bacterium]|nr:electron transport complex subunit RsxA [Clostridiales bacterium]